MTTGVPLYLVSACASAEDFVAAFRRYADRAGLFVPIAEPLPQGRRGRVAVTLTTGAVMVEGEVEVVSSWTKPAPVHGRIGMTLRFVEPDEPSKIVLAELEKARLAMKPQPPSVPPRPATVPAEPRPVPPPVGGRIDAANALAECVMIGDATTMREAAANTSLPGKFVIPTIPAMGGPARPKTPSTPPALTRSKPPTAVPPPTPALGVKATVMGMPAMERAPGVPPPTPVEKRRDPTPPRPPTPVPPGTSLGMTPLEARAPAETRRDPTPVPLGTSLGMTPLEARPPAERRDPTPAPKPTTLGMPAMKPPADSAIVESERPRADETSPMLMKSTTPSSLTTTVNSKSPPPPGRPKTPSTPPSPRSATPFAPLPIVRRPAGMTDDGDEPTDLTSVPIGEGQRKTSLGVQMMSAVPVEPAGSDDSGRMHIGPPPKPPEIATKPVDKPGRSGGLRASEIMAAIAPSDDWTMTPDAVAPTVVPAEDKVPTDVVASVAFEDEKPSGPTGDWTISADPSATDGWTEPAKPAPPEPKPALGNRNIAVASSSPIEAVEWEEKPTGIGEALVQIDPTLMEPLKPMPVFDDEPAHIVSTLPEQQPPPPFPNASGSNRAIPTPLPFTAPPLAQPQIPPPLGPMSKSVAIPTPPPMQAPPGLFSITGANQAIPPGMSTVDVLEMTSRPRPDLTDGNTGFFRETGEVPNYTLEGTDAINPGRARTLFIILGAALGIAAILVVVVFALGKKKAKITHAPIVEVGSGSAMPAGSGSGSAIAMVQPDGSGSNTHVEPPVVDAGVAAPQTCPVEITSVPTGAEVSIDKTVLGTTPATIDLPCGVEAKLTVKKAKYTSIVKPFTPSADNAKLLVKLPAPMFQIKVTSIPSGATITVAGKILGITPSTIKIPAFATSTVTLSKDGYIPDTQKIAPRANNAALTVTLKHGTVKQKLK